MGFRDRSGIDLGNEINPIYPPSPAYFDRLYGPRGWSPPGTTLNFSIGQGENTQTLINMMRFYQGLAGDGDAVTPYIVQPGSTARRDRSGSPPEQLDGLRRALIAVVERGTAVGQPPRRPRRGREDRDRAEPARRGPRLVHRLCPGGQAGARRGRHHGVRQARHHRGAVRGADAPALHPRPRRRRPGEARVLLDETVDAPQDTAPRPIELDPDSAAAASAAADSARRAGPSR